MYFMAYVRSKVVKGQTYYYLVEGKKDEKGKIKQKVLSYIGDKKKLKKFHENVKKHL